MNANPTLPGTFANTLHPAGQEEKRRPVFDKKTVAGAWLSFLVGYLYCRAFFIWQKPVSGLIFTALLFAFALVFVEKEQIKGAKTALFYPVSALILSLGFFLASAPFLRLLIVTYALLAFFLFCHRAGANALEKRAGGLFLFDALKAACAPFLALGDSFFAISSGKRGKKLGVSILLVLAGLTIALIPALIVFLLLSFDENFNSTLEAIFRFLGEEFFARLTALLFGIPAGALFFGAIRSAKKGSFEKAMTKEQCAGARNAIAFCPALVGFTALLPLLFLYGVFIFAQKDYYAAVFSGTLPASHTFSSFARDGFFRLCAVAVINALALMTLRLFTKKNGKGKVSAAVTVGTVILSLVTLILCATALSQMIMYVSAYGLTRLRLYTLWFMGLLALFFLLLTLCRLIPKLPFAPIAIPLFFLCFSLLALPDTDAFIARHNYDCYKKGTIERLDVNYLASLGDSAIPTLCTFLEECEDDSQKQLAFFCLSDYLKERTRGLEGLTLPALLANGAIDDLPGEYLHRLKVTALFDDAQKTPETASGILDVHHSEKTDPAGLYAYSLSLYGYLQSTPEELVEMGYEMLKKEDLDRISPLLSSADAHLEDTDYVEEKLLHPLKYPLTTDPDTCFYYRLTTVENDPEKGYMLEICDRKNRSFCTIRYFGKEN